MNTTDMSVLRELARRYADIAALDSQRTTRDMWFALNDGNMRRPMVLIDQLPWNELDLGGSLAPRVEDPYWRIVERALRQALYRAEYIVEDRVYEPYICLPRPIINTGWGIEYEAEKRSTDESSSIKSRRFRNQINDWDDIERVRDPVITLDEALEARIISEAEMIFDGIIPFRMTGECPHLGVWDTITLWMGVENCYIELMDRPKLMHALMEKMTRGLIAQANQMSALGLFDVNTHICHCSHTYSAAPDAGEPGHPRSQNAWAFGLAQLFTSVSPATTDEFEVEYMKRVFPLYGAIYYGCCDRLDDRMDIIEKLPNVRKISCSPWSDTARFAERLNARYVMSAKPNPALLAGDSFDEDAVRADIRRIIDAARAGDARLELILKDVSTVRYKPERLWRWARVAREEVCR